jgi:hypothetical protein
MSIFTRQDALFGVIEKILTRKFGPIDFTSPIFDFNQTQYYEKEFGANLKRKFISFKKLINPESLWKIKNITNNLENKFSKDAKRLVNIDPGYISQASLVLASTKDFSHRIYIKKGIYQEITLIFKDRTFWPLAWTYPDYQSKELVEIFIRIRDILNSQLNANKRLS